jgi:hypothetical protein
MLPLICRMTVSNLSLIQFLNINSLASHREQVKTCLLSSRSTSILALCETKLSSDSSLFSIPSFDGHNFPFKALSSGLAVFVKSSLPNREVPSLSYDFQGSMMRAIDVSLSGNLRLCLCVVYIRPAANLDVVQGILNKVACAARRGPMLVLGDFNSRHRYLGDSVCTAKGERILEMCREKGLTVLNTRDCFGIPTRQQSVLDLAITNKPLLFSLTVDDLDIVSDHSNLSVHYSLPAPQTQPLPTRWTTADADWELYNHHAHHLFTSSSVRLRGMSHSLDTGASPDPQAVIDQMADLVTDNMNTAATYAMPKAPLPRAKARRFYKLRQLLRRFKAQHRHYQRVKSKLATKPGHRNAPQWKADLPVLRSRFLSARASWLFKSKALSNEDWLLFTSTIEGSSRRVAWHIFKRSTGSSRRPLNSITLQKDDPLPPTVSESLDNMAAYYSKVMSRGNIPSWESGEEERGDFHSDLRSVRSASVVSGLVQRCLQGDVGTIPSPLDHDISLAEVIRSCRSLRTKTAPGPDLIPSMFLKRAPLPALRALTRVFTASWRHGVVPSAWRRANAFCNFKRGSRSDPSAYRIISITSILIRCFERIVKERLTAFLEERNFFHPSQAGFRYGRSTIDQIYKLYRDTRSRLRRRGFLPVIFLDIVKAFDRVPHDRLLYKLHAFAGVTGRAFSWIRVFLCDRQFRITHGVAASRWVSATAGVPQGCVLSPLLFLIYINDLLSLVPPEIASALFADDVAAWPDPSTCTRLHSQYRVMREFLECVSNWSACWQLDFSTSKSHLVIFNNKRYTVPDPKRELRLCGEATSLVPAYKYLGLIMDENGACRSHVDALIAKTTHTAYLIARVFSRYRTPSPHCALQLVRAILIPQIAYAIAFISLTKREATRLTQIIATPLRSALGVGYHASANRVLWEFGIPDISSICTRAILQTVSRSFISLSKGDLLSGLIATDITSYDPRAPSSFRFRPFAQIVSLIQSRFISRFPSISSFPLSPKLIRQITHASMTDHWNTSSRLHHRQLKPHVDPPLYLSVDPKPAVCIRARIRLGVAHSFTRLHLYKRSDDSLCPHCGVTGDSEHILLHCSRFSSARHRCRLALLNLYYPIHLSLSILHGLPPPLPSDPSLHRERNFLERIHIECLKITATFLEHVSKRHFL